MSESLCIAETSPLPEAGADVVTTDGDGALAHSCQDAARWGRGEGVQAWTCNSPALTPARMGDRRLARVCEHLCAHLKGRRDQERQKLSVHFWGRLPLLAADAG